MTARILNSIWWLLLAVMLALCPAPTALAAEPPATSLPIMPNCNGVLTGTGSSTVPVKCVPATIYSVADYGGVCNGSAANGAADTAAINAIFAALRALPNNSVHPTIIFPGNPSVNTPVGNACYITSSINATSRGGGLDALSSQNGLIIRGGRLECHTTGTPCFDMSGAGYYNFDGTVINSPSGATESSYGLQIARLHTGIPAGQHNFNNVTVQGAYTKAAVMTFASEDDVWTHPFIANNDTLNSALYSLVDDGCNHFGLHSAFQNIDIPASTVTSDLSDVFIGGQISTGVNASIVAPIFICGTRHHEFLDVYVNTNSLYAVHFFGIAGGGEPTMTTFDIHVETLPTNTFLIENNASPHVSINGLQFRDSATNASQSIFHVASGIITDITIHNFDVEIGVFSEGAGIKLWDQPGLFAVDGGAIRLPSISNWSLPTATYSTSFNGNSSETVCLTDQNPICQTPQPTIPLNRNPDFVMDQPNEGAANLITSSGKIVTDGWHQQNSGAMANSLTFQQDDTAGAPNNFPFFYNLQTTVTTNKTPVTTNFYTISTNIDGADSAPLRWGLGSQAAPAVLDYCLWSSVAPVTWPFYLTGFNGGSPSYYNIDSTITVASTWQCFSNLIPAPTSGAFLKIPNVIGLQIGTTFGNGPTNTAGCVDGVWQSAQVCKSTPSSTQLISEPNGTVFHMSSIHLYNSFVDNPEQTQTYAKVLSDSQRWYRKSFPDGVKPAQNVGSAAGAVAFQAPFAQVTNPTADWKVTYPPMWTNLGATLPTITFFSSFAASANCYDATATADAGAAAALNNSESGFLAQCTLGVGDLLGDQIQVHFTADTGF